VSDERKITLRGGGILDGARIALSDCSSLFTGGAVLFWDDLGKHCVARPTREYRVVYAVVGAFGRYLGVFEVSRDRGRMILTKAEKKPSEEVVQE
jgi:hypothetical protein